MSLNGRPSKRVHDKHYSRGGGVMMVTEHCETCGAPMCPVCGEETAFCDSCGFFECEKGCWRGAPVGPFLDLGSLN
jgi:hypothetical protein